jgi:hypothetical protein
MVVVESSSIAYHRVFQAKASHTGGRMFARTNRSAAYWQIVADCMSRAQGRRDIETETLAGVSAARRWEEDQEVLGKCLIRKKWIPTMP